MIDIISMGLSIDRDRIENSRTLNKKIDGEIQKSKILIAFMNKRIIMDKIVLWIIIIVLAIINILVLYLKLF